MSLLSFYSLAFCVAALSGLLLPLVGKHLRARGRVLEVFFLAQLALTGSLAARLILTHHVSDIWTLGFSLFVYILGKYVLEIKRNAFSDFDLWMIGGYLSLLSIQYLLIGVFPQLDTHMTAVFFGNLVTASNVENYILIFGCGAVLVAYWVCRRKVNRSTIEQSIFGNSRIQVVDFVLFAFPVVLSLYSLGAWGLWQVSMYPLRSSGFPQRQHKLFAWCCRWVCCFW